jgi:predicted SnoaL-like aldol condensation-catalyzing enzyme
MRKQWRLVVLIGALTTMATTMRTGLMAQTPTETERNRALVTEHLNLMNRGQWKEAAELFSADVHHHLGTWESGHQKIVTGRDSLTANLEDLFRTFPDWPMEIVDMVADGNSVVVRCRTSSIPRWVSRQARCSRFDSP